MAHDYVPGLKQWFSTKGIKNSCDSWHGGKGVKKAIKKVASGLVRDAEKSCLQNCLTKSNVQRRTSTMR